MIVQSSTKITVSPSAVLKDVILIAPEIEIQNNVISNFQAFASKRISIGESVQLQYPSALILNKNQDISQPNNTGEKEKPSIQIGKSSVVKGVLVYLGTDPLSNYKTQIELQKTSYTQLYLAIHPLYMFSFPLPPHPENKSKHIKNKQRRKRKTGSDLPSGFAQAFLLENVSADP